MAVNHRPTINHEARLALGRQLREAYGAGGIPMTLLKLLRRIPNSSPIHRKPPVTSVGIPADRTNGLDPAALTILQEALDEGWRKLQAIGNQNVTREQLAKRLIELGAVTDKPAILAARAVIELMLPPEVKGRFIPTM
jgi:hypothetical protein